MYLYPAILNTSVESKTYKNGKVKEKVIKSTGLKRIDVWANDHDTDKLIERVYATAEILSAVLPMDQFIDYTIKKNKQLLDNLKI